MGILGEDGSARTQGVWLSCTAATTAQTCSPEPKDSPQVLGLTQALSHFTLTSIEDVAMNLFFLFLSCLFFFSTITEAN